MFAGTMGTTDMKKLFILLFFLLGVLGVMFFLFQNKIDGFLQEFTPGFFNSLPSLQTLPPSSKETFDSLKKEIQLVQKEAFMPPPIRAPKQSLRSFLTQQGTLLETNVQRALQGLPPLEENAQLHEAAQAKVQDMFAKQYFAHVSPTDKEAGDLAQQMGYEFILIGENLALGNFENDKALVQAWMESPGHRANILNAKYQEIGIWVAKGNFEGESTWLAVQIFGVPLEACSQPEGELKIQIESSQIQLEAVENQLEALRNEIAGLKRKKDTILSQKVNEYNAKVEEYKSLVGEFNAAVQEYNSQVTILNSCIGQFVE